MRKLEAFIVLFLMCGCMTAPLMQDGGFDTIAIGAPIQEVESMYGQPYEVRSLPNNMQEYVYVQRIDCGRSSLEQTDYTFQVCQGQIVGKHRQVHGASSLQFSQ